MDRTYIELSDSPLAPPPPESLLCNYPLCRFKDDPDPPEFRICCVPGCKNGHHHVCAINAGDDRPSTMCFVHFMQDEDAGGNDQEEDPQNSPVGSDRRGTPVGSQKHLLAKHDDEVSESERSEAAVTNDGQDDDASNASDASMREPHRRPCKGEVGIWLQPIPWPPGLQTLHS